MTTFKEKIISLYSVSNISIQKIADQLGLSSWAVTKVLKAHNIPRKDNRFYTSLPFDFGYFDSIDCDEKAYWLGFIYSDGYITGRVLGIKLSVKDIAHLEKFKKAIKSEHKIGRYKAEVGYGCGNEYCSITINNQHLVDSLMRCG